MIREWVLPGLLDTGPVNDRIMAVRDGLVNFYVVKGPDGLLCVDAGWRAHGVSLGFKTLGLDILNVSAILLTHRHWDHARGANLYPNARVFAGGAEDPAHPESLRVRDGQVVQAAGLEVRVIETPGHTPDSVCYLVDGRFLFTGDAVRLRRGKVASFPAIFNRNREAARSSIRKLACIQGLECLLTAHTGTARDPDAAFRDWRNTE